jgi:signal peptidase I
VKAKIYLIVSIFISALIVLKYSAYKVSGVSMMNTLKSGQLILVENLLFPEMTLNNNDIIVFKMHGSDINLIKRCAAKPRDTISIKDGFLFINSKAYKSPSSAFFPKNYFIKNNYVQLLKSTDINLNLDKKGKAYYANDSFVIFPLYLYQYSIISALSKDNFKIIVPYKGMKIKSKDLFFYKKILNFGGADTVFSHNYYFVLGDNFLYSMDSRIYGFIIEEDIIGRKII